MNKYVLVAVEVEVLYAYQMYIFIEKLVIRFSKQIQGKSIHVRVCRENLFMCMYVYEWGKLERMCVDGKSDKNHWNLCSFSCST